MEIEAYIEAYSQIKMILLLLFSILFSTVFDFAKYIVYTFGVLLTILIITLPKMPEKELIKPSLTQRRKISGSQNLISETPVEPSSKLVKPMKVESPVDESEDISIVKVGLVVVAVIIVAVIAAFLIQATQKKDDKKAEVTPTPTTVVEPTDIPTPTAEVTPTITTTTTPIVTPTPGEENPGGEVLTNEFGQTTQFLSTDATSVKIRTYQFQNISAYYDFALPVEAVSGTTNIPDAKAEYDADGNLVLTVSQVSSFVSCKHLNDNTTVAYRNVLDISCSKSGSTVTITFSMKSKVDFKLTTGKKEVAGEEVDSVLLHIK